MGILSNSAFSRSWMIRLSESFSEVSLPYANEIVLEKTVQIIRTEKFLKVEDIRFSLDSISEKKGVTIINASHILGMGFTIKLVSVSEYETKFQILICDNEMRRKSDLEDAMIRHIKSSLNYKN
jgi:hypothetical protein